MLYQRYPILKECQSSIEEAIHTVIRCYEEGGKLLICGNGGSCADSDHIVGELMKGFLLKRRVGKDFVTKLKDAGIEDAEVMASKLQGALPAISFCEKRNKLVAILYEWIRGYC